MRPPIRTRATEAQDAARKAESERLALSRLADALRDCRALGLAGAWSVTPPPATEFSLRVLLLDERIANTIRNMTHGAES